MVQRGYPLIEAHHPPPIPAEFCLVGVQSEIDAKVLEKDELPLWLMITLARDSASFVAISL